MKKLLLLVIGFTLVTTSCDDFLTENPKHEQVLDNVVTDYQSAQNIVNGVYSKYEGASYLGGYLHSKYRLAKIGIGKQTTYFALIPQCQI